jgi:hypothetical protein
VIAPRLRVVVPYDREGNLIDPTEWPRFMRWAEDRRDVLKARSQFQNSGQYWRTIDAISSQWSNSSKLLLPEMCTKTSVAIDSTGSIPAHSIYAIWSNEWPLGILQRVLESGLLELTAKAEAPTLKLGWMRFYKRFIMRTPLPVWSALTSVDRRQLGGADDQFIGAFERLFGFPPGGLCLK